MREAPGSATATDEVRPVAAADWATEATSLFHDDMALSFDWLSASDEIGSSDELRVVLRFDRADGSGIRLETRLPRTDPRLTTLRDTIPGSAWHERETSELFGITFTSSDGAPLSLKPLLLPAEDAPGHPGGSPLRKDFVLGARAVTPWPADEGGAEDARRRQAPAGVPDPAVWGARSAEAGEPDPAEVAAPSGRRRR
jgi:NADH-quinone oxidoreductase subunit C